MHPALSKYLSKFFIQQWVIGIGKCRPEDILENKVFDTEINWMEIRSADQFIADPFLVQAADGQYRVLFEEYSFSSGYGKIAELEVADQLTLKKSKNILDTGSHLSYPFVFNENGRIYIFPEAAQSGRLTCYEYHPETSSLEMVKVLLEKPLLDSTICKKDGRYWLFCTMLGPGEDRQLHLYSSEQLLGDYKPHPLNPVKDDLNGSRPAGALIEYQGDWFRPAQDSRFTYGGGMVINKIKRLNEREFDEEFYMRISPGNKSGRRSGIRGMHTLNFAGDYLVADGTRWRFAPVVKFRQLVMKFRKNNKQVKVKGL